MASRPNDLVEKLNTANEATWLQIGNLNELMQDLDKAIFSYEHVLQHNPTNLKALIQLANIHVRKESYAKAIECLEKIIGREPTHGEAWGILGHCYLRTEDLHQAYKAYQHVLLYLPNPRDPNLWYGIGVLYEKFQSYEHAEEAFNAVLKMDTKFEKAGEVNFKLAIICKHRQKYDQAKEYLQSLLRNPPRSISESDVYFHIGHIHELQKEYNEAKDAYEKALQDGSPNPKVLQQLGWLYHHNPLFANQKKAVDYLLRSIDADPSDGQTWYLLGRCYMAQAAAAPNDEKRVKANAKYKKAYDAYQQAV